MYQEETNEDITITEYHLCSDCKDMIEVPANKPYTFEVGCLNPQGKPNPSGGLTDCKLYRG